jgi:hypothetical protein
VSEWIYDLEKAPEAEDLLLAVAEHVGDPEDEVILLHRFIGWLDGNGLWQFNDEGLESPEVYAWMVAPPFPPFPEDES